MTFYVLHHGWYMQNNSVAALSVCRQQVGRVEIYIVLIKTTSQAR